VKKCAGLVDPDEAGHAQHHFLAEQSRTPFPGMSRYSFHFRIHIEHLVLPKEILDDDPDRQQSPIAFLSTVVNALGITDRAITGCFRNSSVCSRSLFASRLLVHVLEHIYFITAYNGIYMFQVAQTATL